MTERSSTPPGEALPASALPLPHEVLVWRGMKATPTAVLIDAFVVGDQLEKALIEETARRRRAEVLLFATQQAYVREHEASVVQSETLFMDAAPQPSTANINATVPSQEGVGQGDAAAAAPSDDKQRAEAERIAWDTIKEYGCHLPERNDVKLAKALHRHLPRLQRGRSATGTARHTNRVADRSAARYTR